ncbi:MAG: 4-hydroxy-3-methylbut-2-enyl diphosphate reductase [Dehalococcoidales bacterium]|jgi:4-hydroxy-3-methylbut-2-enyl diphosphate reductase|nr:4-hydroxy-3-methylbut-2-enyl diphosphate reductase [Dehalococcoidales bacterium]
MPLKIEKVTATGFCVGVKRAIDTLERIAQERGQVETLREVVHNRQVMQGLSDKGIKVANSIDEIRGTTVAISAHGVGPQLEQQIKARDIETINLTCSFVRRAQRAARKLAEAGFFVIVYGDAKHPEVRGILGWADDRGIATIDIESITSLDPLPRRLGVLSQTTQVPIYFRDFVKKLVDVSLVKDTELHVIDTICHDILKRQQEALELAGRVDLMLIIGSRTSANTNHLAELCATATKTYQIETAEEIRASWLEEHHHVGVTSGTSTSEQTIEEVIAALRLL